MQTLVFVSALEGSSKKSGRPYSIVRLSNGIEAFVVTKAPDVDVSRFVEGDEIDCEFEIAKGYGDTLKATLIKAE